MSGTESVSKSSAPVAEVSAPGKLPGKQFERVPPFIVKPPIFVVADTPAPMALLDYLDRAAAKEHSPEALPVLAERIGDIAPNWKPPTFTPTDVAPAGRSIADLLGGTLAALNEAIAQEAEKTSAFATSSFPGHPTRTTITPPELTTTAEPKPYPEATGISRKYLRGVKIHKTPLEVKQAIQSALSQFDTEVKQTATLGRIHATEVIPLYRKDPLWIWDDNPGSHRLIGACNANWTIQEMQACLHTIIASDGRSDWKGNTPARQRAQQHGALAGEFYLAHACRTGERTVAELAFAAYVLHGDNIFRGVSIFA